MKQVTQAVLILVLVLELAANPYHVAGKQDQKDKKVELTPVIAQSGEDSGDNRHPSGNDRSVERGKSGNQGKSGSDPDGNTNANGGDNQDKIGFTGGLDKADQDGNNGCGNDDDFEDDNNGRCLGRNGSKPVLAVKPTVVPTVVPTATPSTTNTTHNYSYNYVYNNTENRNTNRSSSNPQVLGMRLPDTGMTQVKIGWMFRILALVAANLAFIFPPKRWIQNAEF